MASIRWMQGKYKPQYPEKYVGDLSKITFRSSWEHAVFKWLDATAEIVAWGSEIEVINYFDPMKNKMRKYYMDIKMAYRKSDGTNQITLIEIKPYKQTIRPKANKNKSEKTIHDERATWITNSAKWEAAKKLCDEKGWMFKIWTEKDIYGGIDGTYKPPKVNKAAKPVRRVS